MAKVIDGMVWCNEIEKWVTPEEYQSNLNGVEYEVVEEIKCSADQDWAWHFEADCFAHQYGLISGGLAWSIVYVSVRSLSCVITSCLILSL